MDKRIQKIIEICKFDQDPSWPLLEEILRDVSFDEYYRIITNKNKLVHRLIKDSKAEEVSNNQHLNNVVEINNKGFIQAKKDFIASSIMNIPEHGIYLNLWNKKAFIGEGTVLNHVIIQDFAYIDKNARITFSNIQSGNGQTYVGPGVTVSNVRELKGCFLSGDANPPEGKHNMYMHASMAVNMIIGAYAKPSAGFFVYNHPLGQNPSTVVNPLGRKYQIKKIDKKVRKFTGTEFRKLPILVGMNATIYPATLIHAGSIIGADYEFNDQREVNGLYYMDGDKQKHIRKDTDWK